jgi:hypothetical protein
VRIVAAIGTWLPRGNRASSCDRRREQPEPDVVLQYALRALREHQPAAHPRLVAPLSPLSPAFAATIATIAPGESSAVRLTRITASPRSVAIRTPLEAVDENRARRLDRGRYRHRAQEPNPVDRGPHASQVSRHDQPQVGNALIQLRDRALVSWLDLVGQRDGRARRRSPRRGG